jgi:hypothetical protein
VHNHLASQTIRILALLMRVVPMGTRRVCDKGVGERPSGLDGALGDSTGTVIGLRTLLPYTMEMKRCCLIRKAIVNSHLYCIADIALDGRNGPFPVDPYDLSREAIRRSPR